MKRFSTSRVYIAGLSFSVLLLIPLWGVLGVFEEGGGGHAEGGHGASGDGMEAMAMTSAFTEKVKAFVLEYQDDDGCVTPGEPNHEEGEETAHEEQPEKLLQDQPTNGHADEGEQHEDESEATIVYLQLYQYAYLPQKLCLEVGVPYEFRMMATDVIHGGSIQLGAGSKMIRIPPRVEVSQVITFTEAGEYLIYCTFYCGLGHQFMQGQIVVHEGGEHGEHGSEDDEAHAPKGSY